MTITNNPTDATRAIPDHGDAGPLLFNRFTAAAMVAGPILLIGSSLFGPVLGGTPLENLRDLEGDRGRAFAYANIVGAAQALLVLAWLRMGAVVAARSRRLGVVGGTLLALGMSVMALYNGIAMTIGYIAGSPDHQQLVTPIEDLLSVPNVGQLSTFFILIGAICLAVGAFRSGALPKVQAVAIGLFALVPVALMGDIRPAFAAAAVAALVGLAPTGLRGLARDSRG